MNKLVLFTLVVTLLCSAISHADSFPELSDGPSTIYGGNSFNKASGDTIDLMGPSGSGAAYIGDFESGWSGWYSIDNTQPTVSHWNISTYNQAVVGNYVAWCGDITIASCSDSLDMVGGYGNQWREILSYRVAVANPNISALVTVTAALQYDTEVAYDFVYLSAKLQGNLDYTNLQSWDGQGAVSVNNNITFLPTDYIDGTDISIQWRFESDGGWSDADCIFYGAGACQVDDILITTEQAGEADIVSYTDFQAKSHSFGDWFIDFPVGVGDYAQLWSGLEDADPCATNYSTQAAFIDDGLVVPGTGGSDCINWCYGPSGYIVNTTGGLAGPNNHMHVLLRSPVMDWPNDNYDGVIFSFDVYRHEDLDADSPGMFYMWAVNSADTDGSAGPVQVLEEQGFHDRNFVYYGGPDYLRVINEVTDIVRPGRDVIQFSLSVYELGWAFGYIGDDGYPAPYFDNVSVKVYPFSGPGMATREIDIAQDNFPEIDALPTANGAVAMPADLATMHVRFDMARNISPAMHLRNDPGDSIVCDIVSVRSGSVLTDTEMHYTIDTNPVFDGVRMGGFAASGVVIGVPAIINNIPSTTKWAFDLPDSGFLFPGDVMHYYFRAGDDLLGDILYSTLPANITGFGDFSGPLAYNTGFQVHGLPSIQFTPTPDVYTQPSMLFWNDNGGRGSEAEWYSALGQLHFIQGIDYDTYYTNGPSSGVGNGIGGRTSGLALEDYNSMLYSAGSLGTNTLSNGDFGSDAGDDISAVLNWLSAGNKNMYLTGDSVASDMGNNAGAAGLGFMENVMGLNLTDNDVRGFIDNQATPLVLVIAGNSVFGNIDSWIAYGGCLAINTFDGVTTRAGAERLAEFADGNNAAGAYSFAALTRNDHLTTNCIVSQPFDFGFLYGDPNEAGGGAFFGRVQVLSDILDHFGSVGTAAPTAVPAAKVFTASNYPNPFNPSTKISYTIKAAGHLSLKVYNVRGQLVKTLIDGNVTESSFIQWDGTNNEGGDVSSGVYFYEARMGNDVQVNKMALVK